MTFKPVMTQLQLPRTKLAKFCMSMGACACPCLYCS